MRTKKPPRKFSDIFAKYKTYNPTIEGYGSVKDWGRAFDEVMGGEEARVTLGTDDPLTIMGFSKMPSLDELKAVYRKLVKIHHPDMGGNPETAKKIIAAYSTLLDRIQRAAI